MIKEFEGRTEKEAIDKAAEELGLGRDCFDVEIIETQRGGLFKKGYVKIRVHTSDAAGAYSARDTKNTAGDDAPIGKTARKSTESAESSAPPDAAFEKAMIEYIDKITALMGMEGKTSVFFREKNKIGFNISTADSSFIIGKKGKTLDALQLIASIYAAQMGYAETRIILDSENYRVRREESLVRLAYTVAGRVRESRASILLEPMNPFDRRLVHTTLNDVDDIETKSEGQGLYKQVRVFYKGARR
ncbi:MAG: protein jag [Spirochaetaceae bacterium]|jgi:spoIIIJ-associated protein|nr:protein jag [Spirochaetaceae bacterium]